MEKLKMTIQVNQLASRLMALLSPLELATTMAMELIVVMFVSLKTTTALGLK